MGLLNIDIVCGWCLHRRFKINDCLSLKMKIISSFLGYHGHVVLSVIAFKGFESALSISIT